jgi:PhzF family phenazine biosynthesis protein
MKYFVVNAFGTAIDTGNPAGVLLEPTDLDDRVCQAIAAENNLSETAFVSGRGPAYDLRWFTPEVEIDLCGHATMASGFVIMSQINPILDIVRFHTKSGELVVERTGDRFVMDFPSHRPHPTPVTPAMISALGVPVKEAQVWEDTLMLVIDNSQQVRELKPALAEVARLAPHAVIVTAPGEDCDFVSRFFAPNIGIDEDPVTGSAHTMLIPFWAERLKKDELLAHQLSKRGGVLYCGNGLDRVKIGGQAMLYLRGDISITTR